MVRHLENARTCIEGNYYSIVIESDIGFCRRHREQAGLAVSSVANHCPVCDRDASAVSYEILAASAAPFLDTHSTSIQDR